MTASKVTSFYFKNQKVWVDFMGTNGETKLTQSEIFSFLLIDKIRLEQTKVFGCIGC